ncbi:hypothetical protein NMG46_04775 [Mesorhizobium sp. LMG 17147]|uniref:hypothetical protein n=1 Tax=Mesorhizobium sp. LMG 17147 TaxID=2963091 RepID=UPI0020C9DF58|nr:hypothetical protein [Mesorhizobium sp. LMG 17147]
MQSVKKGSAKLHSAFGGMRSDDLITLAAVFHFSDSGTHRSILLNHVGLNGSGKNGFQKEELRIKP